MFLSPEWIKARLLLAALRPLREREIWAPWNHVPCRRVPLSILRPEKISPSLHREWLTLLWSGTVYVGKSAWSSGCREARAGGEGSRSAWGARGQREAERKGRGAKQPLKLPRLGEEFLEGGETGKEFWAPARRASFPSLSGCNLRASGLVSRRRSAGSEMRRRAGSGLHPHTAGNPGASGAQLSCQHPFLALHPSLQMLALPLETRWLPTAFFRVRRVSSRRLRGTRLWSSGLGRLRGPTLLPVHRKINHLQGLFKSPSQGRTGRKGGKGRREYPFRTPQSDENRLLKNKVRRSFVPSTQCSAWHLNKCWIVNESLTLWGSKIEKIESSGAKWQWGCCG